MVFKNAYIRSRSRESATPTCLQKSLVCLFFTTLFVLLSITGLFVKVFFVYVLLKFRYYDEEIENYAFFKTNVIVVALKIV